MADSLERSLLHVEGKDDLYAIVNLLIRHGIDYDAKRWASGLPRISEIDSCEKLLAGMELAVKTSTGRAIGFVLDADSPIENRWNAVRDRLQRVEVIVPGSAPIDGLVAESAKYKSKVGVWLMPDNQHDGKLETFLQTLVDADNAVYHHAVKSTKEASDVGASFREVDRSKAEVHTWLAWQENPGLPYGSAIRAQYFGHDSPTALAFVQWFRRLYGLTST
jgi:uncharacterized protein DUF3226